MKVKKWSVIGICFAVLFLVLLNTSWDYNNRNQEVPIDENEVPQEDDSEKPNIIILYADDMGYGDLAIENPKSKIPTPNLDKLSKEGMRFTDGHSSSGICTPSRYALLTGQVPLARFSRYCNWDGRIRIQGKAVHYGSNAKGEWI